MSSNYKSEGAKGSGIQDEAAEAVRRAFAALPLEKKLSTLVRVELDLLGDIADGVASAASKAVDELSRAFNNPNPAPSGGPKAGETVP